MIKNIKKARIKFLLNSICPNYMLTLQLPYSHKAYKFERFRSHVKNIMKKIEKNLIGKKWNKHHYPFVIFYENKGGLEPWHAHILCNFTDKITGKTESSDNIETAISKADLMFRTCNGLKEGNESIDMDVSQLGTFESVYDAMNYCQKEVWHEDKDVYYQVRFEFSADMFGL